MIGKIWALIMPLFLVSPVTFAGKALDNPEKPEKGISDQIIERQWNRITTRGNDSIDEERYICVADKATGFKYSPKTKSWEQANFKVDKEKFIITSPKNKKTGFEIRTLGSRVSFCSSDPLLNEIGLDYIPFNCFTGQFKFNKKTGRFLRTYSPGYIGGDDDDDTPYIAIGKCSPF